MRVVHLCNSDIRGGAARAAFALHNSLLQAGVESSMLVQRKYSNSTSVFTVSDSTINKQLTNYRMILDLVPMYIFTRRERGRFSFGKTGINIVSHPIIRSADIIHIHWINEGFLSLEHVNRLGRLGKPVIWTFHDMWAFTGGCHYSAGCKNYESICRFCPYLKHPSGNDLSTENQSLKESIYKNLNLHVVTCSNWMLTCAASSTLIKNFPARVIPNSIDIKKFKPENKKEAQRLLGLSNQKKYILFGTMNLDEERKGFRYLKEALDKFSLTRENKESTEAIIFGSPSEDIKDIPLKMNFLGRISDEDKLTNCYCAADVFVAPSLEDNLPNTVMEALACGTPVAAFNIGGMPDMVEHLKNGYLAEPFSIDDLTSGIQNLINRKDEFSKNARDKVLGNFTPEIISRKYSELYRSVINP